MIGQQPTNEIAVNFSRWFSTKRLLIPRNPIFGEIHWLVKKKNRLTKNQTSIWKIPISRFNFNFLLSLSLMISNLISIQLKLNISSLFTWLIDSLFQLWMIVSFNWIRINLLFSFHFSSLFSLTFTCHFSDL